MILRNGTIDRNGLSSLSEKSEHPSREPPPYSLTPAIEPPPKSLPSIPDPHSVSRPRVLSTTQLTPTEPTASVSQLHILHKHRESINGIYYIDPNIPSLGFDSKGCKSRKTNPPHASFRTRHGAISLDLATTGDVNCAPKAEVLVGSRSGKITMNLLPMPTTRPRIGLEVFSRHGDIILLLPDSFSGVLQLSTHKGRLRFLPGLAAVMKVLKQSDRDALVSVGDHTVHGDTKHVDFCQLTSRTGKIIVGLSQRDKHIDVKAGFWAALFSTGKSTCK